MALLKKVKAATLVETIVATAIILVVFTLASLSLNNIFQSVVKSNDGSFLNRVKELSYLAKNNSLELPFYEETSQWDIVIEKRDQKLILECIYKPKGTLEIKHLDVQD
tara:strand:- start:50175 stop:50498 length:324 start_codon:yes stop_codon:yes gene_type:complete